MRLSLFLIGIFLSLVASAQQNAVSGTITDAVTGEPIAFANVFFANTRLGVSSDVDGKFKLENFPSGKYDLTVAFVGYTTYQQGLDFNDTKLIVTIKLEVSEVRLQEVVVKADTTGWANNFVLFKKHFLGETSNAQSCTIVNPKSIHLYFDSKTRVLVAHAREPIQIDNKALGFRINYYLHKFELDLSKGFLFVFGIPAFENLVTDRSIQVKRWEKERARTYHGSLIHFIRALHKDSIHQQGFTAKKLYRVPNPDRPSQAFLDKKLRELRAKMMQQNTVVINGSDSLSYYHKLNAMPVLIDSVAKSQIRKSEVLNSKSEVIYEGSLWIEYREKEESGYLSTVGRKMAKWQNSIVRLSLPLVLYENGYYEDARNITVENYWAWSEKMAGLLPLDYLPVVNSKRK